MKKRIGFIAMSGIRAQNAELLKLGLTLPGFVERSKVIASLPSLSLLTLAGMTPPQFDAEYMEIADLNSAGELPDRFDLVAITSLSAQINEAYKVADWYRAKGVPVVMGGLHVSSLPDEALEHCTTVAIGEGESLWPEILADFQWGQLQHRYEQSPRGTFDLRLAPMPRFELLDPDKYNRITVQTARGCPHRCEFCASSILLTPRYKVKPVEKVIAEIRKIKSIWPRPFVEFADDNSFVNTPHARELLRALARERVRWFTEVDINISRDDEILALMRDSGCQQVLIGLESPRRASLHGIELNGDWKARQQERYLAAIAKIQSFGITVNGCFILGLDGDTPEVFEDVLRFVRQSGLYEVQVTFMTAFPGTPLYERLKKDGRLIDEKAWDKCTLFDINIRPAGMSIDELHSGFLKLVKQLYSEEETQTRRRRFRERVKALPNLGLRRAAAKPGCSEPDQRALRLQACRAG
ncbi:MAG: B12-binding domain-containing radical SAM protein [Verrucomicrobia subdivision 3 bacterium]|nr:B12-binding domain-containing radical SAM protein [Limisphaerales bacterium]